MITPAITPGADTLRVAEGGPQGAPNTPGYPTSEGSSLMVPPAEGTPAALAGLVERARQTVAGAVPANTQVAYEGDLRRFASWCTAVGLAAMPAEAGTVALYMRHLADEGRKVSTIERALAAICTSHVRAGYPSPWSAPIVADMRAGLRRELGVRPTKKRAADDDVLRHLLGVMPDNLLGKRDRALLTIGWCAALRRSELVALDVADVERAPKGLVVLVRASKTDQEARGEEVPVFFSNSAAHCPVRSLDAWLAASDIA